jgi:putative hydrolase of the HAD superfamily
VRAVLFDVGATLVYPEPPVERIYARELAADGAHFSESELGTALQEVWDEIREKGAADRFGGTTGEPAFWRAFLDSVRGRLDGGTVSQGAFERLRAHFREPSSWVLYADVLPALDSLTGAGLRLGIVSNWDSRLPELLEGLGLSPRFEAVLASAIERAGKPDKEIFRRACARVGVAPGEALHVGDSLREDYEGALGAGLSALLLDRAGRHRAVSARIESLGELPSMLGITPPDARESAILSPV